MSRDRNSSIMGTRTFSSSRICASRSQLAHRFFCRSMSGVHGSSVIQGSNRGSPSRHSARCRIRNSSVPISRRSSSWGRSDRCLFPGSGASSWRSSVRQSRARALRSRERCLRSCRSSGPRCWPFAAGRAASNSAVSPGLSVNTDSVFLSLKVAMGMYIWVFMSRLRKNHRSPSAIVPTSAGGFSPSCASIWSRYP